MRELVSRLKFHIGVRVDIFSDKFEVEILDNGMVYIYNKE